jgi:hypothetical protein
MKRMLLVLFSTFTFCLPTAQAPGVVTLLIPLPAVIHAYGIEDEMLHAFVLYESNYERYATNKVTGARGIMQLMPQMVEEVNRICYLRGIPKRYTWEDAFDPQLSIEMWYIKQRHSNPDYDLSRACQIWFGEGVQHDGMTWREYEREILKRML